MKLKNILLCPVLLLSIGCIGIYEIPEDTNNDPIIDNNSAYVNTYVSIPYSIRALIAPYVRGYFSPHLYRYCEYLYPSNTPYDPFDLPCYVRADYNGDGLYDYAFLFSYEEWCHNEWYLTTKLLVVLSTPHGYVISCDMILGTVYADACVPIEEYWAINYLSPGYYSVSTIVNGIEIIETVYLPNDAFFLASLDPNDEAIFYAKGADLYEIEWDNAKLEKRAVQQEPAKRSAAKILFKKEIENRKPMVEKK